MTGTLSGGDLPSFTQTGVKTYYSIGGQMIAMDAGSGLQYFLTDHLGSVTAVLSAAGALLSQQRYLPFGEPRPAGSPLITQTDFGYTGQRVLSGGSGLMDYKARLFDPQLGRFLQPDLIVSNPAGPQTWNRYSYVSNRPILFNDPTGHYEACGTANEDPCRPHKDPSTSRPPSPKGNKPPRRGGHEPEEGGDDGDGPPYDPNWGTKDPVVRTKIVWDAICQSGGWWGKGCPTSDQLNPWLLFQEGSNLSYEDQINMARGIRYRWQYFGYNTTQLAGFTAFFNPNGVPKGVWDDSDWAELTGPQPDLSTYKEIFDTLNRNPVKPDDGNYIYWFDDGGADTLAEPDPKKWPGSYVPTSVGGNPFYFTGKPNVFRCAMYGTNCNK